VRTFVGSQLLRLRVSSRWRARGDDSRFLSRDYRSYEAYVRHQKAKLSRVDLSGYDADYRRILAQRLRDEGGLPPGTTVLCLAARLGTEVKAFADLGCFAVGIDLNPGEGNTYVLHGDFHHLQFPPASTDVVFTNSLDHCFDIQRVLEEVGRVLKRDGRLIVEAVRGADEGATPLFYESFSWPTIDDLVALIERAGFRNIARTPFESPWRGEHLQFRAPAHSGVPAGRADR
jgi:SAM-dependent methyltransferase